MRCRLDVPAAELPHPVLLELKAAGGTDYLVLPLAMEDALTPFAISGVDRLARVRRSGMVSARASGSESVGWGALSLTTAAGWDAADFARTRRGFDGGASSTGGAGASST